MCFKIVQLAFLLCEIPCCCAVRSNWVLRTRSYTTSFMYALIFTIKLRTQIPSSLWCLQFSSTLSMIVINLLIYYLRYEIRRYGSLKKKKGRVIFLISDILNIIKLFFDILKMISMFQRIYICALYWSEDPVCLSFFSYLKFRELFETFCFG